MSELFKKKSFWVAVGGVAAVVVNHFFGVPETQVISVIGAVVAAIFGTFAGLKTEAE